MASNTNDTLGSGTAAIGQTTTYSSHPLSSGDPVGSVVDHESTDPLTYQLPEHSRATESTSLQSPATTTSSAATAAASTAWATHSQSERMPGEFPAAGYENPYKATHALDPRVDGGKIGDEPTSSSTAVPAAATTAPVGAAALSEKPTSGTESTAPAPSTLSSAVDPTDRSAAYSGAVDDKGLDSTGATTGATTAEGSQEQQGIAGRVLGSLGIGGAAAAAAGYLGYGQKSDEPHDTSAVATQPAQVSQETGPPKHYRRESIPTTAYPSGIGSPSAIAPPIGGTQQPIGHGDIGQSGAMESMPRQTVHDQTTTGPDSHVGRDVAAGGVGAAALGTGAYGLHSHKEEETAPVGTTSTTGPTGSSTLPDRTRDTPIDAVAAAPGRLDGQDAKPGPTSALAQESERRDEDHTGRNAALGAGAGAAAAGGAAYASHERSEKDAAHEAAQREKELAKQREADQKAAEKAQKEHQKEIEKQEKHHQKEMEKEEKKHHKEAEKEEKKHQKELEKEEKDRQASLSAAEKRDNARAVAEDEDRMRKEREAAAGVGTAAFTGAGMTAHEKSQHEAEGQEPKKKPSIFKRIFKRRKNKDTGEDEDYSTDDEEDKAAKTGNRDSVTGLPYDPEKDPAAAARLSRDPSAAADESGRGTDAAPPGAAMENPPAAPMSREDYPTEKTTGMPFDPSKDPEAAKRLGYDPGNTTTEGTAGTSLATGHNSMSEPFGEIGDTRR